MNKISQPLITIIIVLFFTSIYHFLFHKEEKVTIGYIDNIMLFNSFSYTKDLKSINDSKLKGLMSERDSLINVYETANKNQKEQIENQIKELDKKGSQVDSDFTINGSKAVWKRLNSYIQEYGEINDYDLIIGTQGYGTIMYAEPSKDLTIEVLEYVNFKFEGR